MTDVLRYEYGLGKSLADINLGTAYDISDDGRTIVGGGDPWIAFLGTPIPLPGTWNTDANGIWSDADNWSIGVPNSSGAEAYFVGVITGTRTVTVDAPVVVGSIDFYNDHAYFIAGSNAVTLNSTGAAKITVALGSHTISAPLVLVDDTTISVIRPTDTLSVTGVLSALGVTLTKAGAGTLTISNHRASALTVNEGTVAIAASRGAAGTSVWGALTIAGDAESTAKLDLSNNAAVIDYTGNSPIATLRSQLLTGRGGPGLGKTWNGLGVTSSTAATANATQPESRSIGYAENSALPLGPYTTFRGQPVDDTSVLIAFTRTGDANLDGAVNDDDVTIIGATYAPGVPKPSWALGDFDYNGFVDDDDVTLLGAFYNPAPASVAVPEPGTILLAAIGAIALGWLRAWHYSRLCSTALLLTSLLTCGARADLTDSLIGYWPFDGDGADNSVGNRPLTIFGGAEFASGLFGQALDLHKNPTQYAQRPIDDDVFDFGERNFTVQVWVNYNTVEREQNLFEKFEGGNGPGWTLTSLLGGGPSDSAHLWASGALALYSGDSLTLITDNWNQFVARRRGTMFDLISNGAIVASGTTFSPVTDTTFPLLIGRRNFADGRDFSVDGRLDEAAIWNRALSDAEIAYLYNSGQGNVVLTSQMPVSVWNTNADGNWSEPGNWTAAAANDGGAHAAFNSVITQPRTVTVDVPVTVARIDFDNANAFTIAGANSLTFDAASGDAQINVTAGRHTIATPVTLADNTLVTVTPAASNLAIVGPLGASGITLSKSGAGTLTLNNIRAAGLSISAGTVTIAPHAALAEPSTSVLGALSIAGDTAPAAKLDLTNNAAIIDYVAPSPVAMVRQQIVAGRGGAGLGKTWNGLGVTSTAAAVANAAEPESRSIGYAENSALPLGPYTTFRGQPVDDTSLLIAYTRTGDANLDGMVNHDDVTIVSASYAPSFPNASWALGDFDYNGFVDDDDVTLLGAFYDPSAEPLAVTAPNAASLGATSVPEPSTIEILGIVLAVVAILSLRRDCSAVA